MVKDHVRADKNKDRWEQKANLHAVIFSVCSLTEISMVVV